MKTTKLYYEDAYIKKFSAAVMSVIERGDKYAVILDKTAFFPEEGGQSSDKGTIGGISVVGVYEKDGIIEHITEKPLATGITVECVIDFDERFEKMQLHTAEHIVSGVFHSLFGLENVGFHLGDDVVTLDINGVLSREELNRAEELANKAVFENIPVTVIYPTSEELVSLEYRSKLDITENVRIVNIGKYDSCACCAPHVAYTGEIGIIKLLDFMKHRGGTRITMLAGARALLDYREKYKNILAISAMLSIPQHETADGLSVYMKNTVQTEQNLKSALLKIAELEAEKTEKTDGNHVRLLHGVGIAEAREFVNIALKKIGGVLVALVGEDGAYQYIMASQNLDMREVLKNANAALSGKGGGKPPMMQGTFSASLSEIKAYFG